LKLNHFIAAFDLSAVSDIAPSRHEFAGIRRRISCREGSNANKLLALSLVLIGVTMPAYAQKKKREGKQGQSTLAGQPPANLVERKK